MKRREVLKGLVALPFVAVLPMPSFAEAYRMAAHQLLEQPGSKLVPVHSGIFIGEWSDITTTIEPLPRGRG